MHAERSSFHSPGWIAAAAAASSAAANCAFRLLQFGSPRIDPHPESVPINGLVAVEGTPLEGLPTVDPLELVRMVAVARILMPFSRVRLSAGREELNREAQILCLQAGADSIFYGDTLLTTGNPAVDADRALLEAAGVQASWQAQLLETQPEQEKAAA